MKYHRRPWVLAAALLTACTSAPEAPVDDKVLTDTAGGDEVRFTRTHSEGR